MHARIITADHFTVRKCHIDGSRFPEQFEGVLFLLLDAYSNPGYSGINIKCDRNIVSHRRGLRTSQTKASAMNMFRISAFALFFALGCVPAKADDIRIELQEGTATGKNLVIQLETFKGTSTIAVEAPTSAAQAAAAIKAGFDNQDLGGSSGAGKVSVTVTTTTKKINGEDTTFQVIVISPSTINFNGGFIKTNPFPGGGTSAVSVAAGESRFRLESPGGGASNDSIDWHVLLSAQDQTILAEANLFDVANTIPVDDLLDDIFADLSADIDGLQHIGNEIRFADAFNIDNAYFLYSLSGLPVLEPTVTNHVVDAPATSLLVGLGLLSLFLTRVRHSPAHDGYASSAGITRDRRGAGVGGTPSGHSDRGQAQG